MAWFLFLVFLHSLFTATNGQGSVSSCLSYEETQWNGSAYYYKTLTLDSTTMVDTVAYAKMFSIDIAYPQLKVEISTCYPGSTISTNLELYDVNCTFKYAAAVNTSCAFPNYGSSTEPGSTLLFPSGVLQSGRYFVLAYAPAPAGVPGDFTLTLTAGCNHQQSSDWMLPDVYNSKPYSVDDTNLFYGVPSALLFELVVVGGSPVNSFSTCSETPGDTVMVLYDDTCNVIKDQNDDATTCPINPTASYLVENTLPNGKYYLLVGLKGGGSGDFLLTLSNGCQPNDNTSFVGDFLYQSTSFMLAPTDMFHARVFARAFSFVLPATVGELVTITTCSAIDNLASTTLLLFDSNCMPVMNAVDGPTCDVNPAASTLNYRIETGGLYYAVVADEGQNADLTNIQSITLTIEIGCNPFVDSSWLGAGEALYSDTLIDTDMALSFPYAKLYKFTVTDPSAQLSISTCNSISEATNTFPSLDMAIYDADCNLVSVTMDTDCGTGGVINIPGNTLTAGNYYVLVRDSSGTTGGSLTLHFASTAIPVSPSPSPSDSPSESPSQSPSPSPRSSPSASASNSPSSSPSPSPNASPSASASRSPSTSNSPSPPTAVANPSPSPAQVVGQKSPSPTTAVVKASPSPVNIINNPSVSPNQIPGTRVVAYVILLQLRRTGWNAATAIRYRAITAQVLLVDIMAVDVVNVVDGPSNGRWDITPYGRPPRSDCLYTAVYTVIYSLDGTPIETLYARILGLMYQLQCALRDAFNGARFVVDPYITTLPLPPIPIVVCKTGSYKHFNRCIKICPSGWYAMGLTCYPCDSSCGTCSGSGKCTSCFDPNMFLFGNKCVPSCPTNAYVSNVLGQKRCEKCHLSCGTCQGSKDSHCRSCNYPRFLDKNNRCVTDCTYGTYGRSVGRRCEPCHGSCASCFGGDRTQCRSCNKGIFFYNQQCMERCPLRTYRGVGQCYSCHKSCRTSYCSGPYPGQCSSYRQEDEAANAFAMTAPMSQSDGTNNSWIWIVVGVVIAVVVATAIVAAVYIVWRRSSKAAVNDLVDVDFVGNVVPSPGLANPTMASTTVVTPTPVWPVDGSDGAKHTVH